MGTKVAVERRITFPWVIRPVLESGVIVIVAALAGALLVSAEGALGRLWIDHAAEVVPTLHDHATLNALMRAITFLGEEFVLALAFGGLAWWTWTVRGRLWGRFFILVALGALALDNLLKPLVGRERPDFDRLVPGTGPSFPSGHVVGVSALVFAFAYLVADGRSERTRKLVWMMALAGCVAMAASRVYLGVHWSSDTLAGMWLGAIWVWRCRSWVV